VWLWSALVPSCNHQGEQLVCRFGFMEGTGPSEASSEETHFAETVFPG
jgi:hypothetical protein